jgi:hypothetical protein
MPGNEASGSADANICVGILMLPTSCLGIIAFPGTHIATLNATRLAKRVLRAQVSKTTEMPGGKLPTNNTMKQKTSEADISFLARNMVAFVVSVTSCRTL